MHPRLEFQRKHCVEGKSILNIGSKEDPANLKDFGAINLDINPFDGVDVIADACMLPFKDKSIDVVVCGDVLEHVHDHEKAIKEARRVAGLIVATIPTVEHEEEIGHNPGYYRFSEHVWQPAIEEIKKLFPDAEIEILEREDWIGVLVVEHPKTKNTKLNTE